MIVLEDLPERLKELRELGGYTQTVVADYLGTSQTMYSKYERGANELPTRHLIKLCELYKCSPNYLLGIK